MMNYRLAHRLTALSVLTLSLVQFLSTIQPSVPFWDPGELTAAAFMLQVPHPPGGPLFLLVGRVFSMIPLAGSLGLRVNLVSAVSSSFAVLFLYLIAVRLMNSGRKEGPANLWEAVGTFGSAAIAAITFSVSDTFWFNGSESNYFAASTLLFSIIVWAMLVWHDRSDEQGSGRFLILIGLLVGLSAGVHLMSVPSIFAVGMLVAMKFFVEDERILRRSAMLFAVHAVIIIAVSLAMWSTLTGQNPPSREDTRAYDWRYIQIMGLISVVYVAVFWRTIVNRSSYYLLLAVGAVVVFAAYPGVVKFLPALLRTIVGDSTVEGILVLVAALAGLGFLAVWLKRKHLSLLHTATLALIAAIIGFTTYATILIRANQDPPMNENQPKTFTGLVTYLNREQYGDFPMFKRRWSTEARNRFTWTNYTSDVQFFLKYQMDHMYNRYLFWNFIGRESFDQDAGVNWKEFFGIPFFLGLAGLYFHFRKNWRMASVFLLLFIIMGYMIAFYQNQQDMQPRDREYFYCGSYFVFAVWIGLGVRGLIERIVALFKRPAFQPQVSVGVLVVALVLIPGRMFQINYPTHDRSRNWIPWDFAYNLLQSCAPNAILFTNGDNDTFPLWYLQDVEAIRRDIRIVNLSLVNTPWYIEQLKNGEPHGTPRVKISYTDAEIERIGLVPWQTQTRMIPVSPDVAKEFGVTDTAVLARGGVPYTVAPTLTFGSAKALRVQDLMAIDIIEQNSWSRPIYFSVTCGEDTKVGLGDYMRLEGLAARLLPQRRTVPAGIDYVDEQLMRKQLFDDSTVFSPTYRPGMRFRGLNDPQVFQDENMQLMTRNYRMTYIRLALHQVYVTREHPEVIKTLDRMEQVMPRAINAVDFRMLFDVANLYDAAGAKDRFRGLAGEVEAMALEAVRKNPNDVSSYYNPYRILAEVYDRTAQYGKAADLMQSLQKFYPRNQQLQNEIQRYRRLAAGDSAVTK